MATACLSIMTASKPSRKFFGAPSGPIISRRTAFAPGRTMPKAATLPAFCASICARSSPSPDGEAGHRCRCAMCRRITPISPGCLICSGAFPDCTIVIPFRDPAAHIASLARQHANFTDAHGRDPVHFGLHGIGWPSGIRRSPATDRFRRLVYQCRKSGSIDPGLLGGLLVRGL